MTKRKARKENLDIGIMELGNLTFNEDYMEVCIDILDMSEGLKSEINKSIEIAKIEETEGWKEWYANHPELTPYDKTWSNKPVVIHFHYLRIVLEEGKPNSYVICTGFEDAENEMLEATAHTVIDLSEYENELKKAVINVLIDKFF